LKYLDYSPDFLSLQYKYDVPSSSLHISATLEAPCAVYCAAFTSSTTVSKHSVKSQGNVYYAIDFEAMLTIQKFTPNLVYSVYCMTSTLDGLAEMSMASIEDTRYEVVVPCCRNDLTVDLSSSYMGESQYLEDAMELYFQLDISLVKEVQVNITVIPVSFFLRNESVMFRRQLHSGETIEMCTRGVVVDPTFMSLNSHRDQTIKIASRCPGTFYINVSAIEFDANNVGIPLDITFPNNNIIEMFPRNNSAHLHKPPMLISAVFILDGQEIELRFDSFTNKGGLGGVIFICNKTVDFIDASSAVCYWKSSTRLRIQNAQRLEHGDNITLLERVVSSQYDKTIYSVPVTRIIGSKLTSLPIIVVSSPFYVSSCARFSLDVSSSTGSGGRAWKFVSVLVKTARSPSVGANSPFDSNVSHINGFYAEQYNLNEATSLPAGYLLPDQIYFFQVKLCNFLDKCAWRDHRLRVSILPFPAVYILGNEYRSTLRTDMVRFKALPVTYCNGTDLTSSEFKARFSPIYTWDLYNLYNETFPVLSISRTNQLTSTLTLAPYSLNSDNQYKVVVSLLLNYNGVVHTSRSVSFLSVSRGPLKAVLSTPGYVSIRYGETLLLNASESFDSNVDNARDYSQPSSITIGWSCIPLDASTFVSGCGDLTTVDDLQWALTVNSTQGGYVNAFYRLVLTVSSIIPFDSRISTLTVDVFIEADCCTKLALVEEELVNTQEVVTVEGRISTSLNGKAVWSLLGSALDLSSIILAPAVVNVFTFYPISTSVGTHLVIAPNSLSPGTAYIFQLAYNSNNGQDFRSAEVTITTNDIPRSGFFFVSPRGGVELEDIFFLSASSWFDDQVPLMFRFGYYTESNKEQALKIKNEDNNVETVLPRGHALTANSSLTLDCFLVVYDTLGAYATRTQRVIVNASAHNISYLQTLYENLANETERDAEDDAIEEVKDVFIPPVVVVINCSAAPLCESLNREVCSDVEHTCGMCFEGNFLGEAGHANTFCYNNTVSEEGVEHCFEDSSCGLYRKCLDYTCRRISRSCNAICLLKGQCAFRNITTGRTIDDCFVDDPSCSAYCACDTGFNGPDCDIPGTV
jgi:hypothetical protein